jgi:hypothetical protein
MEREADMQTIPKQPRTKSPSLETPQPDAARGTQSPQEQHLNETVQHAYQASVEGIKSAYLDAQKEHLAAYLTYLGSLQQTSNANPAPTLEYLNDLARAQGDVHAAAEAHRKFVLANADRQVSGQKALIEAATTYSQAVRESNAKLEEQVRKHNQSIAEAIKEALLNMDVRTVDIPSLSLLYQSLRRMSAAHSSGAATSI